MKFWPCVAVYALLSFSGLSQSQSMKLAIPDDSSGLDEYSLTVIKEAYRRIGMTAEFLQYPVKRANLAADSGIVDGILFRREGLEREFPNMVRIPVVIKQDDVVAVIKDKTIKTNGWDSLTPFTVGCLLGFDSATQNLSPAQSVVTVNSAKMLYTMLELGRIDIIVDARTRALQMLADLDLKSMIIVEPPLLSVTLFHYINASKRNLVQPLIKALTDMTNEGLIPYTTSYSQD